eukprot:TRINITY_DN11689_c0_g1_i2.p2 TRINITY_DN11689_c0_g1~~TRINITY_DN11689_c0_g1_i2.p2  ORF type:complete len:110 (-),score=31.95 TRINITY_DN11689_c0_g1_i2:51-380(-)
MLAMECGQHAERTSKFSNLQAAVFAGNEQRLHRLASKPEALIGGSKTPIIKPTALISKPSALISNACLLYTSDAADEEDSVDLGGRRIIKKKKKKRKEKISKDKKKKSM